MGQSIGGVLMSVCGGGRDKGCGKSEGVYVLRNDPLCIPSSPPGDKYCVATKGWLALEGAWLWGVKDGIDRGFMRK